MSSELLTRVFDALKKLTMECTPDSWDRGRVKRPTLQTLEDSHALIEEMEKTGACPLPKPQQLVVEALTSCVVAINNCAKSKNEEWLERHQQTLHNIMEKAPHGDGIDGDGIEFSHGSEKVLQFSVSFHHMDENGYYDGWSKHIVTVKPSLLDRFEIQVSGRDRNGIKELLRQTFDNWLRSKI